MVYVDYDPVVLAHARALLTSSEAGATEYIDADLRDAGAILAQAAKLLDFSKPVAVTLISILHAVPDSDDPHAIVARLMDAVPSGSYLVVSHWGADLLGPETKDSLRDIGGRMVQQSLALRSREQVAQFFAGTDLVDPVLCGWRNGARSPARATRAGRLCGARRVASGDAATRRRAGTLRLGSRPLRAGAGPGEGSGVPRGE